jgi:D-amino-acid oxidase
MTLLTYRRVMRRKPEVLVVGAGVSGLTTAICLVEAGITVRVVARRPPLETTSCAAGALWGPYLTRDERVESWSEESRRELHNIAACGEQTGVRLVHGQEAARSPVPIPAWAVDLEGFRISRPDELPTGFVSGWWYLAPIVDMPVYLRYLVRRLDVPVEGGDIRSLEAAAADQIVVNCTGVEAGQLVADPELTSTRGQLVVVENPDVDWFFAEHDESPTPTYFLPHGRHLVLGGSAEPGRSDRTPDLTTSRAIQQRCAAIEPALGRAKVLEHRVGLRPSRPTVRLEREAIGRGYVVHNYGHGGSGVTLSWGCARDVVRLVQDLV